MKQMSLLDWTPPPTVLVFPLAKRIGKVRRVAEVLAGNSDPVGSAYWRKTVATLVGQLERAGVPSKTVNAELRNFHDAVQAELYRRGGQPRGQGGDAA